MNAVARLHHPAATTPVLFVGLDGAEPDLLLRWMDDGSLPILARLRREGVCESVRTLPGFGDGATWPSLVTGVNPGRHGRYFRRQFEPRSYRRRLFSVDTDLEYEPFWTTLSKAGRRVAVLDLPYARCERDINGLLLVDWLIHDRYGVPRSWPVGFAKDVIGTFGDDPVKGNTDLVPKDAASLAHLFEQLNERVRMKQRLVTKTLNEGAWDLVATAFAEPHDLGHTGWHLHDPGHPQHDPDWLMRHGDPIRKLYIEIDTAIGRILEQAPADTSVVLFMGLGMGPNYTGNKAMDEILSRLEGREYRPRVNLTKQLSALGLPGGVVRLGRFVDSVLEAASLRHRRFFALPHNENSGAIRINLAGREPKGCVPAAAFDSVCDELTEGFLEIRNPATGKPVVENVVRVAHELHGEKLDTMPDLMVVWNRESPFESLESPRIGRIDGVRSWGRTGDHTGNAMLLVRGRHIRRGKFNRTPSIFDVAATICAMQGIELPGIDGQPIEGLRTG